jgi:hypothetical protein
MYNVFVDGIIYHYNSDSVHCVVQNGSLNKTEYASNLHAYRMLSSFNPCKVTEKYSQFGGTILYCNNVQYTVIMCSLQFQYLQCPYKL